MGNRTKSPSDISAVLDAVRGNFLSSRPLNRFSAVKQIHPFSFTLQSLHSPATTAPIPGNYSALCVSFLQAGMLLREVALAKESV